MNNSFEHLISIIGLSDAGKVRSTNEDYHLTYVSSDPFKEVYQTQALLVVADGMGGHALGEVASQLAVETFYEAFLHQPEHPLGALQAMKRACELANERVYSLAQDSLKSPGTTLTVLAFNASSFFLAHVGDSRAYQLRQNQIRCLTADHTWVAQEMRVGRISADEASRSPFQNYISRAIGLKPSVEIDLLEGKYQSEDLFMLCSDGLTHYLRDEEIGSILSGETCLKQQAQWLIDTANKRGGSDNITVALAKIAVPAGAASLTSFERQAETPPPFEASRCFQRMPDIQSFQNAANT